MDQFFQRCNVLIIDIATVLFPQVPEAVCTRIPVIRVLVGHRGNLFAAVKAHRRRGNKAATAAVPTPQSLDPCRCLLF